MMKLNQFSNKLSNASRGSWTCEFKVVSAIVMFLFIANLAYSAYALGFIDGQAFESSGNYAVGGDSSFMIRLRLAIQLGLLVCVVGLVLRTLYGVLASMAAVISLGIVYSWWHRESDAFLRNLEVADYSAVPDAGHVAGLRGGTWWDLLVLVVAAILFVWQVAILIRVMKMPHNSLRKNLAEPHQEASGRNDRG